MIGGRCASEPPPDQGAGIRVLIPAGGVAAATATDSATTRL